MDGIQTKLTAADKEARRKLAITKVNDGWTQVAVADFLGVHPVTVAKWMARYRVAGATGLAAKPVPGRPRFLTPQQEAQALGWLADKPTAHGFPTDLWTARRVAHLIRERFGVEFHPHYLREWLTRRGYSPQKPRRQAKQRDPVLIDHWVRRDWPALQKKSRRRGPISS